MVGTLTEWSALHTMTTLTISEDNLFIEDGHLSLPGLIENIAQTCAARIGYYNKYILRKGIQLGFIGAVRNATVVRLPILGETISTRITVCEEIFGMVLADARVEVCGAPIASAEIKIAIKHDNS